MLLRKWLTAITVLLVGMGACTPAKTTTATTDASEITNALDKRQWIFRPQLMFPQRGRSVPVDALYNVQMDSMRLLVRLPYAGRVYGTATLPETRSPLDFESKRFEATIQTNKKGARVITITPQDVPEVTNMIFTVFTNGSAQLQVQLRNRTPVSFSGTVLPKQ
ncbi:MAG: DUF4251 domain-containing protein [Lacibacter sp.]